MKSVIEIELAPLTEPKKFVELPQDASIVRETERAVLLFWRVGSDATGSDVEFWAPKTALALAPAEGAFYPRACLAKWLVAKLNLWSKL